MELKELIGKRNKIIADQRTILDKCDDEKRDMTTEEGLRYSKLENEFDKLSKEIRDQEILISNGIIETRNNPDNSGSPEHRFVQQLRGQTHTADNYVYNPEGKDYRDLFNRYLIYGGKALDVNQTMMFEDRKSKAVEKRALQSDVDPSGGYLTHTQLAMGVIQDLNQFVAIRSLSRTMQLPYATALDYPKVNTNIGDLTWTSELSTGSEDSDLDFGNIRFIPHPLARRIKISKKLLRTAGINPENLVREQLIYKVGTVQGNAFNVGTGINQPLGIFTASDNGIDTSRDVSTGNTSVAVTMDGLINAVEQLSPVYRIGATWLISTTLQSKVRKLKDGDGQYIWTPSTVAGMPDMLLGFPVKLDSFTPSIFAANQYVGCLGNFQYYLIVDALSMEIQVLTELYAETNQNGYICRIESDGNCLNQSAFVRIQLGS